MYPANNWHLSEINKFRTMDITGFLSFFLLCPFCLFVCLFVVVVVVVVVSFWGEEGKVPKILTTTTKNKFYSFYSQCTFKKNRDNRDMYFPATIYHW